MQLSQNNYAFIDSQNVNLAIRDQGWILDWKKFREYLRVKFGVTKAYVFLGYIPSNQPLYRFLEKVGFVLIFKPTVTDHNGVVKGNVDAELVLHTMIQYANFEKAVIVTGDGDFYCLVEYLQEQNKFKRLVIPHKYKYSSLLRGFLRHVTFLNIARERLKYNKTPQNAG